MSWPTATAQSSAHQAIEARLVAQWVDGSLYRTAIQFPGVLGLVDTDKTTIIATPPTNTAWLKLDVIHGDTEAATYGGTSGSNLTVAIIQLTLFVPRQRGMAQMNELAGLARVIFNRYHANGLRCNASSFQLLPDDKGWMAGMVRTVCEYFEEVTT